MPVGSKPESREKTKDIIHKRQKQVEDEGLFPPVAIYAEGTCQNNRYLLPFKRGAFTAERTVIPVVYKYDVSGSIVHPFVDIMTEF